MKIEYYPIRGRGEGGQKFQLARLRDEAGNTYKGQYDQARHFASESELVDYLATVVQQPADAITLEKMHL